MPSIIENSIVGEVHDDKKGDRHFLIGVTLNYESDGLEFNSVSGLFPKDTHEWIKWIQDGKAIRIDQKDKVQALIDSLRTNPAESIRIGLDLDTISDKVRDFKNPEFPKSSSAKVQTNSETTKNNLQDVESGGSHNSAAFFLSPPPTSTFTH